MTRILQNAALAAVGGILVLLAVSNRHTVPVVLNIFDAGDPGARVEAPLFVLVFVAVAVGALLGIVFGRRRGPVATERAAETHGQDALATPLAAALATPPFHQIGRRTGAPSWRQRYEAAARLDPHGPMLRLEDDRPAAVTALRRPAG